MKPINEIIAKYLPEMSGGKKEYDAFVRKKLEKYGVSSPEDLSDKEKKKFFDEIDREWQGDKE